jgi:PucR C-terminal helix-turn-helix domain/GGDEF-like domain
MSTAIPASATAQARATTVRKLELATGTLASAAIARMDEKLPWYRAMSAEDRSWIGLVAQAGIAAFVSWFREPDKPPTVTADVFGTAPRELARAVSLQQAVEMVRVTIEVTEERIEHIVTPEEAPLVREAVLRYSREVAFAAAEIYARAAEARGAWDARLEASLVDALLRGEADESVRSRAAALGWGAAGGVTVVVGRAPPGETEAVIDGVRRAARHAHLDVLAGVQGDRLVAILGGASNAVTSAAAVAGQFAPGPVVVGPIVGDLVAAGASARVAIAGLRAAPGWPEAPRPVSAEMLLPERALSGDGHARRALVTDIYGPVAAAGPVLLETLSAFLEHGGSVEATARSLFVHPNTVRYRLRRVTDLTGCVPGDPRDSYTLRMALTMGRLMPPSDHS